MKIKRNQERVLAVNRVKRTFQSKPSRKKKFSMSKSPKTSWMIPILDSKRRKSPLLNSKCPKKTICKFKNLLKSIIPLTSSFPSQNHLKPSTRTNKRVKQSIWNHPKAKRIWTRSDIRTFSMNTPDLSLRSPAQGFPRIETRRTINKD